MKLLIVFSVLIVAAIAANMSPMEAQKTTDDNSMNQNSAKIVMKRHAGGHGHGHHGHHHGGGLHAIEEELEIAEEIVEEIEGEVSGIGHHGHHGHHGGHGGHYGY